MPDRFHTIEIEHEIPVAATAERVWAMISDITRIGEWSPECVRSEWVSGEPGQVGSQFVGSNYERNADWDEQVELVAARRARLDRGMQATLAAIASAAPAVSR